VKFQNKFIELLTAAAKKLKLVAEGTESIFLRKSVKRWWLTARLLLCCCRLAF